MFILAPFSTYPAHTFLNFIWFSTCRTNGKSSKQTHQHHKIFLIIFLNQHGNRTLRFYHILVLTYNGGWSYGASSEKQCCISPLGSFMQEYGFSVNKRAFHPTPFPSSFLFAINIVFYSLWVQKMGKNNFFRDFVTNIDYFLLKSVHKFRSAQTSLNYGGPCKLWSQFHLLGLKFQNILFVRLNSSQVRIFETSEV